MFIELTQEEKSHLKATITFDPKKIQGSDINIELPKTSLVYYTSGREKTLAMVFLKKDPLKPYFLHPKTAKKDDRSAFNTPGFITIDA